MTTVGSIVVLELWFNHDSLVDDLSFDCLQHANELVFLLISEIGSRLGVINNSHWIGLIREDMVDIIAELSIIDKAILHLILAYQRSDLCFGQFDVQGTETCSEL